MSDQARRCVLLFSRASRSEGAAKGMPQAEPLFALARRRVAAAVAAIPGVRLVLVGEGPAPEGADLLPQRGRTFGERLINAFADARALGYAGVVAVPTDVPALDAAALARALEAVSGGSAVLGPSPDGGVYLIGLGQGADVLAGVRWCTPHVLEDLRERLGAAVLLAPMRDVDRASDMHLLYAASSSDPLLRALLRGLTARLRRPPVELHLAPGREAAPRRYGRAPPLALAA